MESANKAIMMAFGMLVAVMIIGTIVFVFNNLKVLPEGNDTKEEIEQISAFNLEYEVYDKKIMYGVDVISVLNKAKSNNDKYVQGNFLTGTGYNTDYIIDIQVKLKTTLEERFVVTYLEQTSNGVVEREYPTNQGLNSSNKANAINKFKKPSDVYSKLIYDNTNFWNNLTLKSQVVTTKIGDGIYHLLSGIEGKTEASMKYTNAMIEGDSKLKSLLEQSTEMSQTIKNTSSNKMIVRNENNKVDETNTGWNKATWYPAIYDFKTKKFKCISEEMEYSEKTGRIRKMVFEEI